jgi:hypothetical protein
MKINIKIDKSRFKVKQLRKIEQGSIDTLCEVISKCMHDGQGNWLPQEEGMAILDELDGDEFDEVCEQFMNAVGVAKKSAVPPPIKTQS